MILGTRIFFRIIIKKPKPINTVTGIIILTLVFNVIPRFCIKDSRCFLYIFVPTNQSCSFCEDFAKQNTVNRKNGTVGKIGSTIPTHPIPRQMQPKIKNNNLCNFTSTPPIFFLLFGVPLHAAPSAHPPACRGQELHGIYLIGNTHSGLPMRNKHNCFVLPFMVQRF